MTYNNFKKILQHEISHLYLSQLKSKFPSWFNEGFSMYNAHEFNINRKINISWNLLLKKNVNLNQLKGFLSLSRSESYLYYSQSAASIEAMIFYYGDNILDNISRKSKKSRSKSTTKSRKPRKSRKSKRSKSSKKSSKSSKSKRR